tara:strand:+ start:192 stop:821 length:630 start_codon:yes stop_codon:yes gene_type:complete
MPFIGVQPASALLTSADIQDGQITTAKVADDAITGAKIENSPTIANSLTVANGLTLTDGDITFASGHGLSFSATSDGSGSNQVELLDDFEEGNWTPTAIQGVSSFGINLAKYVKVGAFVFAQCYIDGFSGKGSNQLAIGGLPFTVDANAYSSAMFEAGSSGDVGLVRVNPNATYVSCFKFNSSTRHRENYDGNSLGSHLIFGIGYMTAS